MSILNKMSSVVKWVNNVNLTTLTSTSTSIMQYTGGKNSRFETLVEMVEWYKENPIYKDVTLETPYLQATKIKDKKAKRSSKHQRFRGQCIFLRLQSILI